MRRNPSTVWMESFVQERRVSKINCKESSCLSGDVLLVFVVRESLGPSLLSAEANPRPRTHKRELLVTGTSAAKDSTLFTKVASSSVSQKKFYDVCSKLLSVTPLRQTKFMTNSLLSGHPNEAIRWSVNLPFPDCSITTLDCEISKQHQLNQGNLSN